jgi:hypothetical protein
MTADREQEHDRKRHSLLARVTKANPTECNAETIACSQAVGLAKGRPFEKLRKPDIFGGPIEAGRCSPGATEFEVVLLRRHGEPDDLRSHSSTGRAI